MIMIDVRSDSSDDHHSRPVTRPTCNISSSLVLEFNTRVVDSKLIDRAGVRGSPGMPTVSKLIYILALPRIHATSAPGVLNRYRQIQSSNTKARA